MSKLNQRRNLAKVLACGTALAMVSLMAAPVMAQDATPSAQTNDDAVIVIGTRKSQQSAIDRKKKAKTATDSIVAEDVGAFPDRNIGEAISRIAGVALERGDYNEGTEVALRGTGSGQTNVEIDGLGVQNNSTTSNLAFGNTDSRAKDFREFPADLIKSVDVVKGTTAAMTEGGLGGSIIVQSRTGLDFKKPYMSFRYSYTKNSLSNEWTPDFNLIASRKFLNGRLGVLLNFTQARVLNDNNEIQNATSGQAGQTALVDFDNSPEKTYKLNPAMVSVAQGSAPISTNSGLVTWDTPLQLVTKSAAANTKADCYAAFPALTTAQANSFASGNARNAANLARTNELQTCLGQWADYTPSLIRYIARRNDEQRQNIDLRFDYKVDDHLTIYAKFNKNKRTVDDHQLTLSQGGVNVASYQGNAVAASTTSTPTYTGATVTDNMTTLVRSPVAGSGYYLYNGVSPALSGTGQAVSGVVANINPASVVVDSTHHVTQFSISDGTITPDQIRNTNDYKSHYEQFGANYRNGGLKVDFLVGSAGLVYTRFDRRASFTYAYGPATLNLVPSSGLWNIALPSGLDQSNAAIYSILRAPTANITAAAAGGNSGFSTLPVTGYTIAQQPWASFGVGLQWSPREYNSDDKTYKLDVNYDFEDKIPFFTSVSSGIRIVDHNEKGWGGGGVTAQTQNTLNGAFGTPGYVAPIATPRAILRDTIRACEPIYGTTGTTTVPVGAQSCNYGWVQTNNISNSREGVLTVRQADFQNIVAQALTPAWYQFFSGYPDRGNLSNGWSQIDINKLYDLVSQASQQPAYSGNGNYMDYFNFDCLKVCKGSDGKMYNQPVSIAQEKTTAGYFMTEFEQKLPFDLKFNGNYGLRYVKTDVNGSGFIGLTSIIKTAAFNPANPTAAAGINSVTANVQTTLSESTVDWTPSFNGNIWAFDDKLVLRYAYGRTIARPGIGRLLPQGTCTFDERIDDASGADNGCGTVGNPKLKPYKAKNMNWSLEWYPNKDTQISFAKFRNKVISGSPIVQSINNAKLLAGTGLVDPQTGESVENLEFTYNTYVNAPGTIQTGTEVAFKTAYTFLPWRLKYLGMDGNYAKIESSGQAAYFDLYSGAALPPIGQAPYYYNISIWYDDGATNARYALQGRGKVFQGIAPGSVAGAAPGVNNFPADNVTNVRLPYSPGYPNYVSETLYADFKLSHKFAGGVEYFFEAKNVLKESPEYTQDAYNTYADGTPSVNRVSWPGYRVSTGITIRR